MNRSALKNYAPKARLDFIRAVTDRAAFFGLAPNRTEPMQETGDVVIIGGRAFQKVVAQQRRSLEARIQRQGFDQVMEAMAYTWFNRFVALRYMELHGYLEHGYRVLSHAEAKTTPEILEHAEHVTLPRLDAQQVINLKLDGTREADLYRVLLVAQCNALHEAMPFLFEKIADETELLLPDNLLHSDSIIRKLVNEIDEADWQQVEIIGWLYQFYISDKKDEVIGKVVKSEDIPAATQLFTPNWIVKYLVQNTLGRQWLATYPDSPLRQQMQYYIEPAEQTEDVKAQLAAITPKSLDPEKLTLLDNACGSGHILVEAYDLFKAIYQERGYRSRDIPRLILQKNLFGLEIDDRAAQLAAFALLMKARADDRRIFADRIQPNVIAIQDSKGLENLLQPDSAAAGSGEKPFGDGDLFPQTQKQPTLNKPTQGSPLGAVEPCLRELIKLFEHAKTFGSLIRIPPDLAAQLPAARLSIETMIARGQLWEHGAAVLLLPLLKQAELLATQHDAVVTNPPYMGSKFYCPPLKCFVNDTYPAGKADLYGAFTLRNIQLTKENCHVGMITIPSWMFLSSFEQLRITIFKDAPILSLAHNGRGVWGSDFGSCSFVLRRSSPPGLKGRFLRLFDAQGSVAGNEELECRFHANPRFVASNKEFNTVPGSPVAYWMPQSIRSLFKANKTFREFARPAVGLNTGDNDRFLRLWQEVSVSKILFGCLSIIEAGQSGLKWFPYNKGGPYRKWYGNSFYVINWENDGKEVKNYAVVRNGGKHWSRYIQNLHWMFKEGVSWSATSSSYFGVRFTDPGFLFDVKGTSAFPERVHPFILVGFLTTKLVSYLLSFLNPSIEFQTGDIGNLPFAENVAENIDLSIVCGTCIELERADWNAYERSWDFQFLPLLTASPEPKRTLESSYSSWIAQNRATTAEMKRLEEENNRVFLDAYGLADALTPDIPLDQVTLTVNPAYRYGGKLTEDEQWRRFRQDTLAELVSYALGCMMGRYSLDKPGVVYAQSRNVGFDASQYRTFPADADGIIPLTELAWFSDDATERFVEFMTKAWPGEHLEENLKFIADSLGPNRDEHPRDAIRRYLATGFFKDHLQTYKKRPIYWLFSSGKQRAFQCLVYLHRYHEGTLARMRTEYVIPLQGKIAHRIEQLAGDITAATSTSHRRKLEKERETLVKQHTELVAFDEKLRHYADQRIALDLDDGVKVNYSKFGDLLAEVKAVTGGTEE